MVVILDTDHLTVIQRRAEPAYSRLRTRLSELPPNTVQTTIISFEEQMRGWLAVIARVRNQSKEVAVYQRLQALLRFFNEIPVLDYTDVVATRFEELKGSRLRVGSMDLVPQTPLPQKRIEYRQASIQNPVSFLACFH